MSLGDAPTPPKGSKLFKGVAEGGNDMYWYVGCHSVSAGSCASPSGTAAEESACDHARTPVPRRAEQKTKKPMRVLCKNLIKDNSHKIQNSEIPDSVEKVIFGVN